jgi:hypothetical protein
MKKKKIGVICISQGEPKINIKKLNRKLQSEKKTLEVCLQRK